MRITSVSSIGDKLCLDLSTRVTFIMGYSGEGKTSLVELLRTLKRESRLHFTSEIDNIFITVGAEDLPNSLSRTLIVIDEDSVHITRILEFAEQYPSCWVLAIGHDSLLSYAYGDSVGVARVVYTTDSVYIEYLVHPRWNAMPASLDLESINIITEDSGSGESIFNQLGFKCIGAAGSSRVGRVVNFVLKVSKDTPVVVIDADTALVTLEYLCSLKDAKPVYVRVHSSTERMLLSISPMLQEKLKSIPKLTVSEYLTLYRKYVKADKKLNEFSQENLDHAELIQVIKTCRLPFNCRKLKSYDAFTVQQLRITPAAMLNYLYNVQPAVPTVALTDGSEHKLFPFSDGTLLV